FELELIAAYLPEPLSEAQLETLIGEAIAATGAGSMRDMGQVMGVLKPQVQGRADMKAVSAAVRARLGAA
ncbi:MAG: GatB/YqeY domain-containing protein, partial [Gammaproteobacteria bacterium]